MATIVTNVLSLILALGLNSKIRFKSALRETILFLMYWRTGRRISVNYFFTYILPAFGKMIGNKTLSSSMLSSQPGMGCHRDRLCVAVHRNEYHCVLFRASRQCGSVYEAGAIDGATGFSKFRYLTFPLIVPFFSINMVLCVKNFLMVFDQIMALTKGGPAQSTESISYLIYNNGMSGGQFGFQSANAVIFFIVIVIISAVQLALTGKRRSSCNENESKRKSELAGNDPSDPWPYHSGLSALYDNCDRIQAADRDDQQCSRDPVSAREIQSCQFQGSYGGNRLLAFSWKQCIDHCDLQWFLLL